jgi:hypothetical protein
VYSQRYNNLAEEDRRQREEFLNESEEEKAFEE